jgi:methionyl-tRNA synthetase
MLIDANECPLCGGRKADSDFCEVCTAEIEAAPLANMPMIGDHMKRMVAFAIMQRNNRLGVVWDRAKAQAEKRQARLLCEQPDEVPRDGEDAD